MQQDAQKRQVIKTSLVLHIKIVFLVRFSFNLNWGIKIFYQKKSIFVFSKKKIIITMLQVQNISFGYTDKAVIKNIDFTIEKDKMWAIIESGCGKYTAQTDVRFTWLRWRGY
jgi:ABC-type multidrug transport system fused ATPase/permease subunit